MKIAFKKYQGTGNDFVIIDNREQLFDKNNSAIIKHICNRKFGIGSDGLILIENHEKYDFNMVFFNPDGSQSFCGNGSRCAVQFAYDTGIITQEHTEFISTDGWHEALVLEDKQVKLKMHDVSNISRGKAFDFMNTGSPHYVTFTEHLKQLDIVTEGSKIRYADAYQSIGGTNVNFIEQQEDNYYVRTYERGVENETLSCGTGVTACALSIALKDNIKDGEVDIHTQGGQLTVALEQTEDGFKNIWLQGPATFVFKGELFI
ncbi:MAG: diaminopimelate epimerase [Flavobacteriales bacterium]|jgi:diaminopimelate epimerase|nr:diaminopimelate epimerase [Flavobacteriales bacterium]